MSVQLSYTKETANALRGLVADIGPYTINSFTNEVGIIPFGVGVGRGTTDRDAVIGLGTGFLGIATRMTAKENTIVGGEQEQYNPLETMGIIRKGFVWCEIVAGGVHGDTVDMDNATGVITVGGAGTPIGKLETSVAANELGIVKLFDDV